MEPAIESGSQPWTSPFARPALRRLLRTVILGILALSLLSIGYYPDGLSWGWSVFLAGVAAVQLFHCTSERTTHVAPLLLLVFYVLGYVLVMVNLVAWPETTPRVGFGSVGAFSFTDDSFADSASVITCGSMGFAVATWFVGFSFPRTSVPGAGAISTANLRGWMAAWTLASFVVVLLTWQLGIGRTGIEHATILPFKMTGALALTKSYMIPASGTIIMASAVRAKDRRTARWTLAVLTVVGIIASVTSLSRSYLPFCIIPPLFLLLADTRNSWSRGLALRFSLIALPLAGLTFQSISGLREIVYYQGSISEDQALHAVRAQSTSPGDVLGIVLQLATERVGGLRELLGILSSGESEALTPWKMFGSDPVTVARVTHNAFGLDISNEGGQAFGIGIGLWGTLASGGDLIIVFAGSAVAALLVCGVEELFRRRGLREVGVAMALFVGLRLWTQPVINEAWYFVVIVAATYWLLVVVEPRRPQRYPSVQGSSYSKPVAGASQLTVTPPSD